MRRTRLVALLPLVALLAGGCVKASTPGGGPVVVVPVTRLDEKVASGLRIAVDGAEPPPRVTHDLDDHTPGDRVEVALYGSWLPATLVERDGDRWLVHYDERHGAAVDALDELVERERIRLPLPPMDDDSGPDVVDP